MSIATVPDDFKPLDRTKSSPRQSMTSQGASDVSQNMQHPVSLEETKPDRIPADAYDNFTAKPNDAVTVKAAHEPLPSPTAAPIHLPSTSTTSTSSPVLVEKEDHEGITDKPAAEVNKNLNLDALGGSGPTQSSAVSGDVTSHDHEASPFVAPNEPQVHAASKLEPEAKNIGWNELPSEMAAPLVTGIANDDLWQLIRRFDMQMYCVKAVDKAPPGGLDLNVAADEEFSLDKMRSNFERLYMIVFIGMLAFVKHVARLRSWHEKRRTTAFCAVYFSAWAFNLVLPLLLGVLIALIVYPPARTYLFPPAPLAAVNSKTGGLQTPPSGTLASESFTGAPEAHKGQAVEQEASNLVAGVASLAVGAAMGNKPADSGVDQIEEPDESKEEKPPSVGTKIPDPTEMVSKANEVTSTAKGDPKRKHHDKTKQPMQDAIWVKARPVMHGVAEATDTWERFANALSPTPPFPRDAARLKMGGAILPLFLVSLIVKTQWVVRGSTFLAGVAFFSQPFITKGWVYLNTNYPHWMEALDLKNSLLYGVPTNAQLTITLLRLGEANKTPLPPPPVTADVPPPNAPPAREMEGDLPVTAHEDEILANSVHPDHTQDASQKTPEKKKHGKKLIGIVKGITRAGVSTVLGVDAVKATAGSESALQKRGVLPKRGAPKPADGPSGFTGRLRGKKGTAYILTTATTPSICFEHSSYTSSTAKPVFSIALNELAEIRKVGGLGWKTKLVVGFALGMEITDGIVLKDKSGKSYTITALPRRDELFNRLISMTDSYWEAY